MIRKAIFLISVISMGLGLLIGQAVNEPGPKPARITTVQQTADSIHEELERETRQKHFLSEVTVARFVYRKHGCTGSLAELTARNAIDHGISVRLVAAVVIVESTCRPQVISSEGAVGLMQILPQVWHVSRQRLKDPAFNLAKGTEILARYVRPYGVREGLHHYNGLGVGCSTCDAEYADKVLLVAGMRG